MCFAAILPAVGALFGGGSALGTLGTAFSVAQGVSGFFGKRQQRAAQHAQATASYNAEVQRAQIADRQAAERAEIERTRIATEAAQARHEAAVAQRNADASLRNMELVHAQADNAKARGNQEAQEKARKVLALIGSRRANLGGSGVLVDSGTAAVGTQEMLERGSAEQDIIRANTNAELMGFKTSHSNLLNEYNANIELADLRNETATRLDGITISTPEPTPIGQVAPESGGFLGFADDFLSSAAPVASRWYTQGA